MEIFTKLTIFRETKKVVICYKLYTYRFIKQKGANMKENFFWGAFILALLLFVNTADAQILTKTFKVINKTGVNVTSVRISTFDAYTWSMELNTMEKIPNNGSFEFQRKYDTSKCDYEFKFTTEDGVDHIIKSNLCASATITLAIPEEKPEGEGPVEKRPENKSEENPTLKTGDGKVEDNTEVKTETPPDVKPEEKKDK